MRVERSRAKKERNPEALQLEMRSKRKKEARRSLQSINLTIVPRLGRRLLEPVQLPDVRRPGGVRDALVQAVHRELRVGDGLGVGLIVLVGVGGRGGLAEEEGKNLGRREVMSRIVVSFAKSSSRVPATFQVSARFLLSSAHARARIIMSMRIKTRTTEGNEEEKGARM